MCTVIKRIGPSLAYLEQVRQHMARLPSIDPNMRTILICGFPNVGKSSFMNKITRADVDVQPFAFTTKSLFVGHTDYKYLRYQVIDTPGILDRPLEDRNIIEMCSITALSSLRSSTVLFFLDISGSCGYTIAQQASLFHGIKEAFKFKPLMIVCNKIDLQQFDALSGEDKKLVDGMKAEAMTTLPTDGDLKEESVLVTMSTLTEEGVINAKNIACERLLDMRVEMKMQSKKINDVVNRFHVAMPKPRDGKERPVCIPQQVLEQRAKMQEGEEKEKEKEKRKLEKDLEEENGGAGVYSASLKKHYLLADDEWKEDIIPEIIDGHNVADFMDADILERLEELEREEGFRLAGEEGEEEFEIDGVDMTPEEREALNAIRKRKKVLIQEHRIKKSTAESRPIVPRKFDKDRQFTTDRMGRQLSGLGLDPSKAIERARSKSVSRIGRKRERSVAGDDSMEIDNDFKGSNKKMRLRSLSRSRSRSRPPVQDLIPGEGFKDKEQKVKALKLGKSSVRKRNKDARKGEGDRVILNMMPKHLFSGKRGIGKTSRR